MAGKTAEDKTFNLQIEPQFKFQVVPLFVLFNEIELKYYQVKYHK